MASDCERPLVPPRAEVQEIDTRGPFDSVKAAVSLFGQVAVSSHKPDLRKPTLSCKSVIDKERQLLLARRELNDIKQKLDRAKRTEAEALAENQRGKQTLQDLARKIKAVINATQDAIAAKENAKQRESELSRKFIEMSAQKRQVDVAREQCKASAAELNAAKKVLDEIRQDFDGALAEKTKAFHQAAEAQHWAKVQSEKACKLSMEIVAMKEALEQLKLASEQAEQEEEGIEEEQNALREAYQATKEEAEKKLELLKKEYDPELMKCLRATLLGKAADVEVLQEEMKMVCFWRATTMELNEATRALRQLTDQEQYLRKLVSTLTWELEAVRKEQAEIRKKEIDREAIASQKELRQLLSKTENARHEAEEMKGTLDKVKHEAKSARLAEEETRRKLEVALRDAEEAKAAEKKAFDKIMALCERQYISTHTTSL